MRPKVDAMRVDIGAWRVAATLALAAAFAVSVFVATASTIPSR